MKYNFIILVMLSLNVNAQQNTDSLKYNERYKSEAMYHSTKYPEAQTYYETGVKLFDENNFREAVSYYKKALEIDPSFIDAMDNLGNSYRYLGVLDSAKFWYDKSIAIFPKGYIAHQNLAIVYIALLKYKEALAEYDKLIALDPENAEGYFGKTNVFVLLGKGDEVIWNAQKSRELYKRANDSYEMDAVYMIGIGYYLKKDKAQAKKYLTDAKNMGKEIPAQIEELLK